MSEVWRGTEIRERAEGERRRQLMQFSLSAAARKKKDEQRATRVMRILSSEFAPHVQPIIIAYNCHCPLPLLVLIPGLHPLQRMSRSTATHRLRETADTSAYTRKLVQLFLFLSDLPLFLIADGDHCFSDPGFQSDHASLLPRDVILSRFLSPDSSVEIYDQENERTDPSCECFFIGESGCLRLPRFRL